MLDPFDARLAGDARITTHLFGGSGIEWLLALLGVMAAAGGLG